MCRKRERAKEMGGLRGNRFKIIWNVSVEVQGMLEPTKGRFHVFIFFFCWTFVTDWPSFMKMMQGESCFRLFSKGQVRSDVYDKLPLSSQKEKTR